MLQAGQHDGLADPLQILEQQDQSRILLLARAQESVMQHGSPEAGEAHVGINKLGALQQRDSCRE